MTFSKNRIKVTRDHYFDQYSTHVLAAIAEQRMKTRFEGVTMQSMMDFQNDIAMMTAASLIADDTSIYPGLTNFDPLPAPLNAVEHAMKRLVETSGSQFMKWTIGDIYPWFSEPMVVEITEWMFEREQGASS